MNLDGLTYSVFETENLVGTTNSSVTPLVKSYEGFTSPESQTVTIMADGTTVVEYNLEVTRQPEGELSSNASVKDIEIDGHEIDFEPNVKEYKISVSKKETDLDIEVETEDIPTDDNPTQPPIVDDSTGPEDKPTTPSDDDKPTTPPVEDNPNHGEDEDSDGGCSGSVTMSLIALIPLASAIFMRQKINKKKEE